MLRVVRERLEAELRALERELNVELPREIQTAVAMGDLRENAEYHAALERQRYVRARIGQLRTRLGELATLNLDRIPRDRVGLGSTIVLLDLDSEEEVTYELVIPEMSDLEKGLISTASCCRTSHPRIRPPIHRLGRARGLVDTTRWAIRPASEP